MESNTTKPNRRTEEEWFQLIQECRTSGLSDKEWCRQNNVSLSNFYYHIRRLTKKACQVPANQRTIAKEQHEIVPLRVIDETDLKGSSHSSSNGTFPNTVAVRLSYHEAFLEIPNHADQGTIENVFRALRFLC